MKEDRRSLLLAMLHGVPAGLPSTCGGRSSARAAARSQRGRHGARRSKDRGGTASSTRHQLRASTSIARSKATFVPHEAVRKVENQLFCISGPARTPHVWAQTNVNPETDRALVAPREPGRYRVFARGGASGSLEIEEGAPAEVKVTLVEAGVRPGGEPHEIARRRVDRRPERDAAAAPREDRAPRLRQRRGHRPLPVDHRRVPPPLLAGPAEAGDAAQGRARVGALQRSHRVDGALLQSGGRRRVSAGGRSLRRDEGRHQEPRRRPGEDDGRRRPRRLPRAERERTGGGGADARGFEEFRKGS